MRLGWIALALAVVLGVAPASAQEPAPFHVAPDSPTTIVLDGPLAAGDGSRVWAAVDAIRDATRVELSGTGGSWFESLAVAEIIRGLRLDTRIVEGATCTGGCALMFMAGIARDMNGTIGFVPFDPGRDPSPADAEAARLVPELFAAYGAAPEFLAMLAVLPADGRLLAPDEAATFGVERRRDDGERQSRVLGLYEPREPNWADPEIPAAAEGVLAEIVVRAEGTMDDRRARAFWSKGGEAGAPFIRADTYSSGPPFWFVGLAYFRDAPAARPFAGARAVISLSSDELPREGTVTGLSLVVDGHDIALPFGVTIDWAAADAFTFDLWLLRALTPFFERMLADADWLVFTFTLGDGRNGEVRLPVGSAARAALGLARGDWRN